MEAKFLSITPAVTRANTPKPPSPAQNANAEPVAGTTTDNVRDVDGTKSAGAMNETANMSSGAGATERTLDELVSQLNQQIQSTTRALRFSVDEKYGRPIVSVVDKETDEVIRQIPTEVALQVADALEVATGVLVSERA